MRILVGAALLESESTVGHIWGLTDDGTVMVHAAGDWRQVLVIGQAIEATHGPVWAEVEDWQVLDVWEAPKAPEG